MSRISDVTRMVAAARAFRSDADRLSAMLVTASDGAYLLNLVAFEILLKALLLTHGATAARNHDYAQLFSALPAATRTRVIAGAATRISSSASFVDIDGLLAIFGQNFTALRYPYEAYVGLSDEAYAAAGRGWVASGASESEAVFVYHPEELFALTEALDSEISAWTASSGS